jgi:geranylgeranyl pyrophosphate synthase
MILEEQLDNFKEEFNSKLKKKMFSVMENASYNCYPIYLDLEKYTESGGKRIHAFLIEEAYKTFSDQKADLFPIQFAFKCLHTSSLIEDDAIDSHDLRHNNLTLYKKYGAQTCMTHSSILYCLGLQELLTTNMDENKKNRIIQEYSDTYLKINESFVQDMRVNFKENSTVKIESYPFERSYEFCLDKMYRQTGKFVESSLCVGGIIGNANEKQLESLRKYGRLVGYTAQISDDLLDIDNSKNKAKQHGLGNDIKNGCLNLLMLYAIKNNKIDKNLLPFVEKAEFSDDDINIIIDSFKTNGAINFAYEKAHDFNKEAIKSLKEADVKSQFLNDFPDYLLKRAL